MVLPDEGRVAEAVAVAFGTEHHIVTIGQETLECVPALVRAIEEPLSEAAPS